MGTGLMKDWERVRIHSLVTRFFPAQTNEPRNKRGANLTHPSRGTAKRLGREVTSSRARVGARSTRSRPNENSRFSTETRSRSYAESSCFGLHRCRVRTLVSEARTPALGKQSFCREHKPARDSLASRTLRLRSLARIVCPRLSEVSRANLRWLFMSTAGRKVIRVSFVSLRAARAVRPYRRK